MANEESEPKQDLPQINLKHIKSYGESEYTDIWYAYLVRDTGDIPIGKHTFRMLEKLGEDAPNLVNTNRLAELVHPPVHVSGEQYVAEIMHWLSQPDRLGNLLQPENYGTHTVGYKLAATVKIEHMLYRMPEEPPFFETRRPGILNRLLGR